MKKIIDTSRASLFNTVKQIKNHLIGITRPEPLPPLGVIEFPRRTDPDAYMHHGEELPADWKKQASCYPQLIAANLGDVANFLEDIPTWIYKCGYTGFNALRIERAMLAALYKELVEMHVPAPVLEVVQHRYSKVNVQFEVIGDVQPDLLEQQNATPAMEREAAGVESAAPATVQQGGDSDPSESVFDMCVCGNYRGKHAEFSDGPYCMSAANGRVWRARGGVCLPFELAPVDKEQVAPKNSFPSESSGQDVKTDSPAAPVAGSGGDSIFCSFSGCCCRLVGVVHEHYIIHNDKPFCDLQCRDRFIAETTAAEPACKTEGCEQPCMKGYENCKDCVGFAYGVAATLDEAREQGML